MPRKMPWFKFYTEVIDDPKLADFSDAEYRMWTYLLCLARESSVPGVIAMSRDQVAWRSRRSRDLVDVTLEKGVTKGMLVYDDLTITVVNFRRRQDKKPSDSKEEARERKRRSREKAKHVPPEGGVTSTDGHALSRSLEVEEEEEVEGEGEEESPNPPPIDQLPAPKIGRPTGIGLVAQTWESMRFPRDLANSGEPRAFVEAALASGVPAAHLSAGLRAAKWFVDEGIAKSLLFTWQKVVEETPLDGTFRWSGTEWPGDDDGPAPKSKGYDPLEDTAYTLAKRKRVDGGPA